MFGHVSYEDEAAPSLQDVPIGEADYDDDVERIQDNDLKEHMVIPKRFFYVAFDLLLFFHYVSIQPASTQLHQCERTN